MSKPRRPRGPRSTWEPKPPQVTDRLATLDVIAEPSTAPSTALPAEIAPELPPDVVETALAQAAGAPAPDPEPEPAPPSDAVADAVAAEAPDAPSDRPAASGIEPSPETLPVPLAAANANASPASRAAFAPAFTPDRIDVVEIGSTVARYMRGEGEAAFAHLRALSGARTPADLIRLQVGEVQRAADASLTCWVTVVRKASRIVAFR